MPLALDGPRSKDIQQKAKAVYDIVVAYGKVTHLRPSQLLQCISDMAR